MKKVIVFSGRNCGNAPDHMVSNSTLISFPETSGPNASLIRLVYALNQYGTVYVKTNYPEIPNFLGSLISEKKLDKSNVKIVIMDDETSEYFYDDEGVLMNWPFGYYEPNFDEIESKIKF